MLAIYTVLGTGLVSIIISYLLWDNGYKKLGIDMFRGTLGAVCLYFILVLVIGLAPTSLG